MARLTANGVEMRAQTLFTASGRAVVALQMATGMKLQELIDRAKDKTQPDHEVWGMKAMEFLSEQTRGNLLTWDQVWDRPLPAFTPDPGDVAQAEDDTQVPTPAGTGTPAADTPDVPAATSKGAKTPRSRTSSPPSRGSKGKSARGS